MEGQVILTSIVAGLFSGGFLAAILTAFLQRRTTVFQNEIKSQFDRQNAIFTAQRAWKEKAVSQLLGPMYMQLDRTQRGFARWKDQNIFLEANVIRKGN